MEERELTALLRQAGDRVTPGPAPVRDILREGRSLRQRRSGRVRVFAVAAAAAAVVGGGAVAATVLDLPSPGGSASDSAAGAAGGAESADSGAGSLPKPQGGVDSERPADGGVAAEDVVDALIVSPDVAQAGDTVRLTSRDEKASYALAWRLERRTDEGRSWEYTLASGQGGADPIWWPAAEDRPVDSLLVPYSEPIALLVPPSAAPGEYRICQEAGTQDLCGTFQVG